MYRGCFGQRSRGLNDPRGEACMRQAEPDAENDIDVGNVLHGIVVGIQGESLRSAQLKGVCFSADGSELGRCYQSTGCIKWSESRDSGDNRRGLVDWSPNAGHRYRGLYCESGFPLDACEGVHSLGTGLCARTDMQAPSAPAQSARLSSLTESPHRYPADRGHTEAFGSSAQKCGLWRIIPKCRHLSGDPRSGPLPRRTG